MAAILAFEVLEDDVWISAEVNGATCVFCENCVSIFLEKPRLGAGVWTTFQIGKKDKYN